MFGLTRGRDTTPPGGDTPTEYVPTEHDIAQQRRMEEARAAYRRTLGDWQGFFIGLHFDSIVPFLTDEEIAGWKEHPQHLILQGPSLTWYTIAFTTQFGITGNINTCCPNGHIRTNYCVAPRATRSARTGDGQTTTGHYPYEELWVGQVLGIKLHEREMIGAGVPSNMGRNLCPDRDYSDEKACEFRNQPNQYDKSPRYPSWY